MEVDNRAKPFWQRCEHTSGIWTTVVLMMRNMREEDTICCCSFCQDPNIQDLCDDHKPRRSSLTCAEIPESMFGAPAWRFKHSERGYCQRLCRLKIFTTVQPKSGSGCEVVLKATVLSLSLARNDASESKVSQWFRASLPLCPAHLRNLSALRWYHALNYAVTQQINTNNTVKLSSEISLCSKYFTID